MAITTDTIYEWMSDNVLKFYVQDRSEVLDNEDDDLWDGSYVDIDGLTEAAYEKFGAQVDPETYRDHGKNPLNEESRLEFFYEVAQLVGEPR